MDDKEYTYKIDKYTIGVDTNGEDRIGLTVAKIENGEINVLGNCYGENARCIDLLIKENRELKKQVETYEIEGYEQNEELNKMSFDIRKYKVQQKEFIKWLEDKIKFSVKPTSRVLLKSILANYKEIIGVKDENNIK